MENAPLIGLSRQIALMNEMDVIANNLANMNTSGFKSEKMLFQEFMMPAAADESMPPGDQTVVYTQDWATIHDFAPGAMMQTGNPLDVALEGDGMLVVSTPAGQRYTRNGELHINNSGILVTNDGDPVLSEAGPITFEKTDTNITIAPDGSVLTNAGNKGRLQIIEFPSPQLLQREGSSLYSATNPAAGVTATNTRLRQGMVEGSNVSGVTEMSNMIRVNRAYELVAQYIQKQDDLTRTAIERLGQLA